MGASSTAENVSVRLGLQCASPGGVPERPKGTGCKPVGSAYGGSNPPAPTHYGFRPLLTTRPTRAPCRSSLCGLGLWEITRPFFTFVEKACLILPTEQSCALSTRFACFRRLPLSLGTAQSLTKEAVAKRAAVIESTQLAPPVQAPLQPL